MPLAIAHLNCFRRVSAMMEAVSAVSSETNDWLIGFTEPSHRIFEEITASNSKYYGSLAQGKAGILTSDASWQSVWTPAEYDLVVIKRNVGHLEIICSCIYISHQHKSTSIRKLLTSLHAFIRQHRAAHHIIMGDLNSRHPLWSFQEIDSIGRMIGNSLLHLRFVPVLTPNADNWTHGDLTRGCVHWIDALLCTVKLKKYFTKAKVVEVQDSDHRMHWATLRLDIKMIKYPVHKMNKPAKLMDLSFLDTLPADSRTADAMMYKLERAIEEVEQKSRTWVIPRNIKPPVKWTKIVRQSARRHNKFKNLLKHNPRLIPPLSRLSIDSIDRHNLRSIPRLIARWRTRVNRKKYMKIAERIGCWGIIKKILGPRFNTATQKSPTLSDRGSVDPLQNLVKDFQNTIIDSSPNRPLECIIDVRNYLDDEIGNRIAQKVCLKPCRYDKFISCKGLKALLKYHFDRIMRFVVYLVSCIHVPQMIKRAKVQLIPKKDCLKFRPLAILHPIYRLIDGIIFTILKRDLNPFNMMYQYAFLGGCNAADLFSNLRSQYDRLVDDNLPITLLLIDITNAFEMMSFEAIKFGLHQLNIDSNIIKLIVHHISNRQSYIDIDNTKKWKTHTSGAPQGGFLSPILFVVAINPVWYTADYKFRPFAFADDLSILCQADSKRGSKSWTTVEDRLSKLNRTLAALNLTINPSKTKACFIYKPNGQDTRNICKTIRLGEHKIEILSRCTLLGVDLKLTVRSTGYLRACNTAAVQLKELRKLAHPLCSTNSSLTTQTHS